MELFKDDHRGHTIFPHASGPSVGPFVASYSAWKIEPNNSYRAVVQGTLVGTFQTKEVALSAAIEEAKNSIDNVLDAK
jgi:hypothetical protein